jgi:alcohol dehydrogenase class IV
MLYSNNGMAHKETIFGLESIQLKFGRNSLNELGWELSKYNSKKILLVVDPVLQDFDITQKILDQIKSSGVEVIIFDNISVEPTLKSLEVASQFALENSFDLIVAAGGGSTIDTAKVTNLIKVCGGAVMDYVNVPIGKGKKPTSQLLPLIAIPTTSGSGSEATTVAVLDIPELKLKTGISHRFLRPTLALVDPELSKTTPSGVTASAGLDVICHAIESFISKPYHQREKPNSPDERPPYQGSNPVSDIWSMKAIDFGGKYLSRAVLNGDDIEARGNMMLSATLAGIGFGTAGVHIPHACAYPIAGLKYSYQASGYKKCFVPHGFSVIVTAPAVFRFTYDVDPEKHIKAAELLKGSVIDNPSPESLSYELIKLMKEVGAPSGIKELGYVEQDISKIIKGAMKQQRLLSIAPKEVSENDLNQILIQSMENW